MKENNYLKILIVAIAASAFTDLIRFIGLSYMEKYHPGNRFMLNNSKSGKSAETKGNNSSQDNLMNPDSIPLLRQSCPDSLGQLSGSPTRGEGTAENSAKITVSENFYDHSSC